MGGGGRWVGWVTYQQPISSSLGMDQKEEKDGFALMIQLGKFWLGGVGRWVTYKLPLSSSPGLDQYSTFDREASLLIKAVLQSYLIVLD